MRLCLEGMHSTAIHQWIRVNDYSEHSVLRKGEIWDCRSVSKQQLVTLQSFSYSFFTWLSTKKHKKACMVGEASWDFYNVCMGVVPQGRRHKSRTRRPSRNRDIIQTAQPLTDQAVNREGCGEWVDHMHHTNCFSLGQYMLRCFSKQTSQTPSEFFRTYRQFFLYTSVHCTHSLLIHMLLPWCYSDAKVMLQWCYSDATVMALTMKL